MRNAFFAFFMLLCLPHQAHALAVSEHSLRIEDRKEGNALLGADHAVLERGEIYHTIVLLWGNLDVHGEIDEVVVLSGHVVFHDGSKLKKSIVVMGGSFESNPGAEVAAENVIAQVPGPFWRMLRSAGNLWRDNIDWVAKLFGGMITCLLFWLLGWILFRVFPGLQKNTAGKLAKEWPKNLVLGFFGSIAACVTLVLLVISILGIALVPLYLLALLFAAFASYMAAALWAGHRLLPPKGGKLINPLGFLLGLFVFQFLWVVPVWFSAFPVLLLWLLAWGALVRSLRLLWK